MKKKKVMSLIAVVMTAVLFAACGGGGASSSEAAESASSAASSAASEATSEATSETSEPADAGSESSDGEYEIVLVPKNTTNSWFQVIADGGADYAEKTGGINWYMKGSDEADASQQVDIIESLIASDVDALCVVPNDIDALEPVLQKARDAGILVITHEASTQQNCDYDIEAFDNVAFGRQLMDYLADWCGEEGEYCVMVGSLTNGSHNEWADGAVAQAEEKYPNMVMVGDRMEINDDVEKAYSLANEMLSQYPNLKGFIGTAAQCVPGFARAVEEQQLQGKVFVSGMALASQAKQYLENGTLESVLAWDPYQVGIAMCDLAYRVLEGEEVTDGMALAAEGYESCDLVNDKVLYGAGWVMINKDNVDTFNF